MGDNNLLKRQLTGAISVEIVPVNGASEIKERIWVVNWFCYKTRWLYKLYNKLASKYAFRVGGQVLFKGHNQKTLLGEDTYARQTLLIVTYPNISNFLEMLTIKAFQLVSLLRVNAVKDFVFGFTKRVDRYEDTVTPIMKEKSRYLVFHYQGKSDPSTIVELAKAQGLTPYFAGKKIAQIKRFEKGKEAVLAPFFMDGMMIFEVETEAVIKSFVESIDFTQLIEGNTSNYAAIFTRVK